MQNIVSPLMLYFARHAFLYLITVLVILIFVASLSELVEYNKQISNFIDDSFYICLKMVIWILKAFITIFNTSYTK